MKKPVKRSMERVLERSQEELLKKANVVGVGIGEKITGGLLTGRLCLKVYVEKKLKKTRLAKSDLVPLELSQIETDVGEVGKIKPQGGGLASYGQSHKPLANTARMRPALGGASIPHEVGRGLFPLTPAPFDLAQGKLSPFGGEEKGEGGLKRIWTAMFVAKRIKNDAYSAAS